MSSPNVLGSGLGLRLLVSIWYFSLYRYTLETLHKHSSIYLLKSYWSFYLHSLITCS
jgi:hypothetical protein